MSKMEKVTKTLNNLADKLPTDKIDKLSAGHEGMMRLVVLSVVVFMMSFYISPNIGSLIKRMAFYLFFSFLIISSYAYTSRHIQNQDNPITDIENLSKNISEYISTGVYLDKYKNLTKFSQELMSQNPDIYSLIIGIDNSEDSDSYAEKDDDSVISYRSSGRILTLTLPLYKGYKNDNWFEKGKQMSEDEDKYSRGIWVDPFADDKISNSILFPCVYPIIKEGRFIGVVACCLTLY